MSCRSAFAITATILVCSLASRGVAQYCCQYDGGCFDAGGPGDPLCVEYQGAIVVDRQCDYGTNTCSIVAECTGSGPDPACSDGTVCTRDVCVNGTCQHPPACYDGDPCTRDVCGLGGECSYPADPACGVTLEKHAKGYWEDDSDRAVQFELIVRTGEAAANIELHEIVPRLTVFYADPSWSTPGWTCTPDGASGSTCTFPVGQLGAFDERHVNFAVQVLEVIDAERDTVLNEASIPELNVNAYDVAYGNEDHYCTRCLASSLVCSSLPKAVRNGAAASSTVDLVLLHRLRDGVFASTPAGARATELYYDYSPALVVAAAQSLDVITTATAALAAWNPVVQALVDGRGDVVKVTREQVARFEDFLEAVRAVAGPDLRAALEREVMLVEPSSFAMLSARELLTRLERLSFEVPSALDPFHCYGVKPAKKTPKFTPVTGVEVVDPGFAATTRFDVKKPSALCVPAGTDGAGIMDAATHLERYDIKAARNEPKHARQRGLKVATPLGLLTLDTVKPTHVLVPTAKDPASPPPPPLHAAHEVDHYACYAVKIAKGASKLARKIGITIGDQLTDSARTYLVKKPTTLCTPVEKNGEAVKHPTDHLVCYQLKAPKRRCDAAAPVHALGVCRNEGDCGGTRGETAYCTAQTKHAPVRGLHTANQFGAETLDAVKDAELCLPALRI